MKPSYDLTFLNTIPFNAGSTYQVKADEYIKNRIRINAQGTRDKPITIQAESGTMITNKTTLSIKGSHIILEGFTFKNLQSNKSIKILGDHITLRNNTFEELQKKVDCYIEVKGKSCRLSNNTFRTMSFDGNLINVIVNSKEPNFCLIDNNTFSDRKTKEEHKRETIIQIGDKKTLLNVSKTILYNNKFNNIESNEVSLIDVSSSSNIFSTNTITNTKGNVVIQGKDNFVLDNFFNSSLGVMLFGTDHFVKGNTFERFTEENPINSPIVLMADTLYVKILENDFLDCFNCFSIGLSNRYHKNPTNHLEIVNNRIIRCSYMYNKDKSLKGYEKESIIKDNPIFRKDQKLRLKTGLTSIHQENLVVYNLLKQERPLLEKHSIQETKEEKPFDFKTEYERLIKTDERLTLMRSIRKKKIQIRNLIDEVKKEQKRLDELICNN